MLTMSTQKEIKLRNPVSIGRVFHPEHVLRKAFSQQSAENNILKIKYFVRLNKTMYGWQTSSIVKLSYFIHVLGNYTIKNFMILNPHSQRLHCPLLNHWIPA